MTTQTYQSITPFLRYFMAAVDNFPASTTPAESKGFQELQQHIVDCLDEVNHLIARYLDYKRLKSTVPKMNEIEDELKERIPSLFK